MMLLAKFRQNYPQGSLVSELIDRDRGTYIVKVSIVIDNLTIATGLAGDTRVEVAEDRARERAIALLILDDRSSATPQSNAAKETVATNRSLVDVAPEISSTRELRSQPLAKETTPLASDSYVSSIDTAIKSEVPIKPPILPEINAKPTTAQSIVEENTAPPIEPTGGGNLFEGTLNTGSEINLETSPTNVSIPNPVEKIDFNEIIHETDIEVKRLGWTKNDGREFLKSRYGKQSRVHLTDEELLGFLEYLKSQPSPN